MRLRLGLVILVSLSLVACSSQKQLPQGEQMISGILQPVVFKLARRGTHILMVNGEEAYYVESQTINLFSHEGHEVTVKGRLERNTDKKDLPVLIVSEIDDPESELMTTEIPSAGIRLDVPASWAMNTAGENVSFTAQGNPIPAMSIFWQLKNALPASVLQPTNESGSISTLLPFSVLNHDAILYSDPEANTMSIFADENETGDKVRTFLFSQKGMEDLSDAEGMAEQILQSAEFLSSSSAAFKTVSSGSMVTGSGTRLGDPCGGSAGILCPSGSYCEITDTENNVGKCVSL